MYYRMTVAGLERDLPICPLNEKLSIAGFVIFGDQELTVACARDLLAKAPEYDYILTAEAKGIPLAHEMARQAGDAKYILARKAPRDQAKLRAKNRPSEDVPPPTMQDIANRDPRRPFHRSTNGNTLRAKRAIRKEAHLPPNIL